VHTSPLTNFFGSNAETGWFFLVRPSRSGGVTSVCSLMGGTMQPFACKSVKFSRMFREYCGRATDIRERINYTPAASMENKHAALVWT
jgi:hypothetical protein